MGVTLDSSTTTTGSETAGDGSTVNEGDNNPQNSGEVQGDNTADEQPDVDKNGKPLECDPEDDVPDQPKESDRSNTAQETNEGSYSTAYQDACDPPIEDTAADDIDQPVTDHELDDNDPEQKKLWDAALSKIAQEQAKQKAQQQAAAQQKPVADDGPEIATEATAEEIEAEEKALREATKDGKMSLAQLKKMMAGLPPETRIKLLKKIQAEAQLLAKNTKKASTRDSMMKFSRALVQSRKAETARKSDKYNPKPNTNEKNKMNWKKLASGLRLTGKDAKPSRFTQAAAKANTPYKPLTPEEKAAMAKNLPATAKTGVAGEKPLTLKQMKKNLENENKKEASLKTAKQGTPSKESTKKGKEAAKVAQENSDPSKPVDHEKVKITATLMSKFFKKQINAGGRAAMDSSANIASGVANSFMALFVPGEQEDTSKGKSTSTRLPTSFDQVMGNAFGMVTGGKGHVVPFFAEAVEAFQEGSEDALDKLDNVTERALGASGAAIKEAKEKAAPVVAAITDAVAPVVDNIAEAAEPVIGKIEEMAVEAFGQDAVDKVGDVTNNLSELIEAGPEALSRALGQRFSTIRTSAFIGDYEDGGGASSQGKSGLARLLNTVGLEDSSV